MQHAATSSLAAVLQWREDGQYAPFPHEVVPDGALED